MCSNRPASGAHLFLGPGCHRAPAPLPSGLLHHQPTIPAPNPSSPLSKGTGRTTQWSSPRAPEAGKHRGVVPPPKPRLKRKPGYRLRPSNRPECRDLPPWPPCAGGPAGANWPAIGGNRPAVPMRRRPGDPRLRPGIRRRPLARGTVRTPRFIVRWPPSVRQPTRGAPRQPNLAGRGADSMNPSPPTMTPGGWSWPTRWRPGRRRPPDPWENRLKLLLISLVYAFRSPVLALNWIHHWCHRTGERTAKPRSAPQTPRCPERPVAILAPAHQTPG